MKKNILHFNRVIAIAVILLLKGGVADASTTCCTASSDTSFLMRVQDSIVISRLNEVMVTASFLKERRSPMRISTVDRKSIEQAPPHTTYPQLLKNIPGLFATSESGSYGDARINIRGFKQENISVMLNGIPISGLVTGNMFWNNWLGLSDATQAVQVQKGIGASMLSDNSVGGTINIITTSPAISPSLNTSLFYTSFGLGKSVISLNTGKLKGGWNISLLGSYAFGDGYVKQTPVSSWAYMLNISKEINSRHSLLFSALGSPEQHEQRSARLTYSEVMKYGVDYNKNWGMYNGKPLNLSKNFYHKPYFTLHHFYRPYKHVELANSAYLAIGNGGGRWSESKGKKIIDFQKDGQIDWAGVVEANKNSGESLNILANYLAGHTQAGFKSNLSFDKGEGVAYTAGLHYQYYYTWEKERITDLLGGNYWYEKGYEKPAFVGDYIRTNNGKIVNHLTLYSMVTYSSNRWEGRVGASLMGNTNQRWDAYNYNDNIYSKVATGTGFSVKGGGLYRVSQAVSLYLNAAYYSRIPYSNIYFSSGNNTITKNVKNEKNILSEGGVRVVLDRVALEVTSYAALWKNKSVLSEPYKQQMDDNPSRYMVRGLDAFHYGVEAEIKLTPATWVELTGFCSLGSWRWTNDVSAIIYDPYSGVERGKIDVYSKGLAVGDAPQTQVGGSVTFKLPYRFNILADWSYNSRQYADFDPVIRTNPADRQNSYRVPDYHLINTTLSKEWGGRATLYLTINNLLNSRYIERGKDGYDHSLDTFTGYWSFGINGTLGLRLSIF